MPLLGLQCKTKKVSGPVSALAGEAKQAHEQALVKQLLHELGPEVDEQLLQGGEEGLTERTLRRWLVARKWVLDEARRDLAAHAVWRRQYVPPPGRISHHEPMIQENLSENKIFLQGLDYAGHPILISLVRNHLPKAVESTQRLVCYALDAVEQLGRMEPGWDGKAVSVMCLTGMTMKNGDLPAGKVLFTMLQDHFPERLHRLYLFNAPVFFYALFKLTRPFMDPVTAHKIVFVSEKNARQDLLPHMHEELLPPELGGTGDLTPLDEAWRLLLLEGTGSKELERFRARGRRGEAVGPDAAVTTKADATTSANAAADTAAAAAAADTTAANAAPDTAAAAAAAAATDAAAAAAAADAAMDMTVTAAAAAAVVAVGDALIGQAVPVQA